LVIVLGKDNRLYAKREATPGAPGIEDKESVGYNRYRKGRMINDD
jgi:hypothetical protein